MIIEMNLKDTVGYMLAQVCKLHRQRADELLTEIGLHVGQEMILVMLLDNEGITQTKLAERMMIQPPTLTNSLKRLEREGFVMRRPDLEDQRISRVHMTNKGHDLMATVNETWNKLEEESFEGFSLEERVLLHRLIIQTYQNLARQA